MKKFKTFLPGLDKFRYRGKYILLRMIVVVFMLLISSMYDVVLAMEQHDIYIVDRQQKIEKIFEEINSQTGLTVIYNNDKLNKDKVINLPDNKMEINALMYCVLKDEGLSYEINSDYIIVKPEPIIISNAVQQKDGNISGTVVDDVGEPLPGVAVIVKGTQIGTATDVEGHFNLTLPEGKATLVVSFIGMQPKEISVKGGTIIKVVLEPDATDLDEVVVTGMVSTDKRLFTGASQKIAAQDVKIAGLADVSRGLEGRAAGVSVQNVSGTFGTAPKIRVRGATSIYGNSKPLWVVDGVIMDDVVEMSSDDLSSGDVKTLISSAIAGLNSEDIESYEILKDGSATSIYGARAMAGVIVITTKKGRAGVSKISYTGEYTYRLTPSYGDFNIMNSQEQMSVYEEMREAGWLNYADVANASESGIYGRMYNQLNQLDENGNFVLPNTPESIAAFLRNAEYRNTDWFDELFKQNVMHNHSVSISSGNDRSTYYASLSALVDPGWTLDSKVNRYTANLNSSFDIRDNLKLNIITNGSYRKQKAPGTLSQNKDVVTGEVKRDFDINPYSFALNSSRTLDPNVSYIRNYAPFNIKKELKENSIDLNVVNVKFQSELKWKPFSNLELSALGALKYQSTSQEHDITEFSNQAEAYRAMGNTTIRDKNPFLYTDPDDPYALPVTVLPQGGIYKRTNYSMLGYDFRATASYKNVFKDVHIVNIYGGTEVNYADREQNNFTGWGMQYSMGEIPFYSYELFKKGIEDNNLYYGISNTRYRNVAFFANGTYSFNRKYTLNGTIRYEGSNKLGKSRSARWLPTWNVSGAWNVDEEQFFESLRPILSHLTLKASYSLTADRGPYNVTNSLVYIDSQTPWRPSAGVKESSLYIKSLENSELTYEKKHELNFGLEMGFLNNRLNTTFDIYKRNNFDLIGIVNTQGLGGEVAKYGNVASMESNGYELSISSTNVKTQNFKWQTNFVYSKVKNEVTELETTSRVIDLVTGNGFAREGYSVRSIFSIPFKGLNDEGLPTFINQSGETTTYDVYFQERDNLDFLEYSGSADPTDIGSLNNTFTYKGLRLNVFMTYSFGNVIRLDPVFKSSYSDLDALPREFKNRWVAPGDEKYTDVPVIATKRQQNNIGSSDLATAYNAYNYSSARIAKGDFVRMKEISLSYDFSKELCNALKVSNLSVRLQATNLFLIYSDDKLNGQDPEFFNAGGVAVPVPKQYTFTLKLGL
ncbi:SusC/RagA family TonB-linked outer membrane protein [Plebeiibacterium sediminum]|uniref:SusC/RagA family TonB-linked outer membrane protein n=1 Tax=Plebeiibacterium sediminum TaxID=2992112 RepID=A0AAE3M3X2_9BACT|nr:SusC/RagA family TonB-linked outer membrane protein [Plebeiobacterium sediminum]MCW3786791.1 SusC/RagA family TonB-linked outer membrane protein [Plebeiobacterium sediminum]